MKRFLSSLVMACVLAFGTAKANQSHGFEPLALCPPYVEGSEQFLKDKLREAMASKSAASIEIYMGLLQCRIGTPHSPRPERYIVIRNTRDITFPTDRVKTYYDQISEMVSGIQIPQTIAQDAEKALGQYREITDTFKAVIFLKRTGKNVTDSGLQKAKEIGDWLITLQGDNTDNIYTPEQNTQIRQAQMELAAAIADLGRETGEERYKLSAQKVAAHFSKRQIGPDFLFNAALANLYAHLAMASVNDSDREEYLQKAVDRLKFGVLPSMYESGQYKGMWIDPVTQRLQNRFRLISFMLTVHNALDENEIFRHRLKKAIKMSYSAILIQYEENKGIQIGNEYADMMCAFSDSSIKMKLPDHLQIWHKRARNFALADIAYNQYAFLTRPYPIMCMVKTAIVDPDSENPSDADNQKEEE